MVRTYENTTSAAGA